MAEFIKILRSKGEPEGLAKQLMCPKGTTLTLFLIICPSILLVAVASILVFSKNPPSNPDNIFNVPQGQDFLGILSDVSLTANIQYEVEYKKSLFGGYMPISRLQAAVKGPIKTQLKILIPSSADILAKDSRLEKSLNGMHSFLADLDLKKNETKIINFMYRTEKVQSLYALNLLPVAGNVTFHISVKMPDKMRLNGDDWKISGSSAFWDGKIKNSKKLKLSFVEKKEPFHLVKAEIITPNMLSVTFSEEVLVAAVQESLNFSIKDLNKKNKEVEDRIFIEKIVTAGQYVTFLLRGMTLQRGENYEVKISNIKSRFGDLLNPNPAVYIVAQPSVF